MAAGEVMQAEIRAIWSRISSFRMETQTLWDLAYNPLWMFLVSFVRF